MLPAHTLIAAASFLLSSAVTGCSSTISVRDDRAAAQYSTFQNDIEVLIRMGSGSLFLPGDRARVLIVNHSRRPLVLDFSADEYYYYASGERARAHILTLGAAYPRFVRYKEAVEIGLLTYAKSLTIDFFEFHWKAAGLVLSVPPKHREAEVDVPEGSVSH